MLCTLTSGSSGNCSLLSFDGTNILIDCGISGKRLGEHLAELGLSGDDIDAILITHEHIDHISGAGVVSRRFDIPVYATCQTHMAMNLGKIKDENIRIIEPDRPFEIGGVGINAFCIPHDAAAPVGYRFYCGSKKLSVATDIGMMTDELLCSLSGSETIILEANHDIEMLKNGPYPERLKARILSTSGHMSNGLCADTALLLAQRGAKNIMLAHLSEQNNTLQLAHDAVAGRLSADGAEAGDVRLKVASRYEVTAF